MLSESQILQQEQETQLAHFSLFDVDKLVSILQDLGKKDFQKVCILITKSKREVYFHAGNQTSNENNLWITKKANVVDAFDHSSLLKKAQYANNPDAFYSESGLSIRDYAIVGGGMPILVNKTGIVGTIVVSGLTDESDHSLAYEALKTLKQSQND